MESYTSLLEKLRVPQPSLQQFAVVTIFSKLRSAPKYLDSDSDPGRDAISRCLRADSSAVVDQAVRELCRLVADARMEVSRGMLELQSALEGCESRFVDLFVKGLGFLVRFGFQSNGANWRFGYSESHPFVKVLLCRSEVQSELVQQVLLLMAHGRRLGMGETCEFLRPFLNYSILQIPFSDSSSSMFARNLISSMASLCCSLSLEALPIFRLLTECLKNMSCKNSEYSRNFIYFAEQMVDAQVVLLRHLAGKGLLIAEAQVCSVELLETILSVCSSHKYSYWIEPIAEVSRRLLAVQKDIGFQYLPKLSSAILSLFIILAWSELEHEQLSILKLLHQLLKWKYGNEIVVGGTSFTQSEELLLTFPVICLLSSPSKSIKGAATDVLIMLEKIIVQHFESSKNKPIKEEGFPPISTPGSIIFRLLHHEWFQDQYTSSSLFIIFSSGGRTDGKEIYDIPKSWAYQLKNFCSSIVDRRKSLIPLSPSQETFVSEMPLLLSAIAGVLLMHQSLGSIAVDSLSAIAIMDPKMGTQFLVAILFYNNIFTTKDVIGRNMLLKLLGMLPALASHYGMIPLIVQTIMPMLQKDSKRTLYATAIRLLCQTWEMNDRAFGSLQGVLLPKGLTEFESEREICISIASSIKDVCKKNADRGVDLILSVSACIESRDPTIQAFGFQSLSHLCEADVIDFYTAWDIISKYMQNYSSNATLAHSICLLLRWGAMDAEAYPEASTDVLQILWGISTSTFPSQQFQWEKAKISALEALAQYEVSLIEQKIPDFKEMIPELLFSETNLHVLRAMEELQVKIIAYEHSTRRRLRKERGVAGSTIEKLLDVFPQVIFSSGKGNDASQLSGAALLCLSFTPKDMNTQHISSKGKNEVHAGYEKALLEFAASLKLSRNIFIALISVQSWKTFMCRWLRAEILLFDAKAPSTSLDKTTKAANAILKRIMHVAKDSIPRSSENIALAIGALCAVLPPSVHTVKSAASKFLLDWLFQHEHEHRQWSAAISLGLISSCLHVTDQKQKFQNIIGLLEVLCNSKSTLVKGACGVGLGFSCQDLLTRVATDDSDLHEETNKTSEADLLGKIVSTLLLMISQSTRSSPDNLESLFAYFPPSKYGVDANIYADLSRENDEELEEDIWGVAGIVLGLASSIGAIYRVGLHDAVLKLKGLIVSWIPRVSSLLDYSGSDSEDSGILLAVGSSLALPSIVAFCHRMELMDVKEIEQLMNGYKELISELVSVKRSGIFHQSLLMSSCIGAGNLLACILNEGVLSIEVQSVKALLELFRNCYSNPHPPLVHLGAMLGVVNSMGADAGILFQMHPQTMEQHAHYEKKESNRLIAPLLSSPVCEPYLTSLMQEIFLMAQNADNHQLQQYAAWAASLLRNQVWSKEYLNLNTSSKTDITGSKYSSQNFADDNAVMKLSSWIMNLNLNVSGEGSTIHINSVVTVLHCLSRAPRLPSLDWGAIVRRCMRYEAHAAALQLTDPPHEKGILREQCIEFSLAHANQFDELLNFLDELSDLPRFRALELNLQSYLLMHLADLVKVFSGSRLEKLFDDVAIYMSSLALYQAYDAEQKSMLKKLCWKGLYQCLDGASVDFLEYVSHVEKCMMVLFSLLPAPQSDVIIEVGHKEEWSVGVRCLTKARLSWLLNFLEVSQEDTQKGNQFSKVLKKIQAKAKLVSFGCFTSAGLGKIKALLLNSNSQGIWEVLTNVAEALQHVEGSVQRQWLMDAVEISCVSTYPSTALRFLGLLSGSCSKYMPVLILHRQTVLSDLPVTLSSLLSEPSWRGISESVALSLWASTERIYNWAKQITQNENMPDLQHPIDESENEMGGFLLRVVHCTCLSLKDHLPLEKQLKLANMVVP